MRKCQYALEEIVFYLRQADEGKRMAKVRLYMGELTRAPISQMGISSQYSHSPIHISKTVLPTVKSVHQTGLLIFELPTEKFAIRYT